MTAELPPGPPATTGRGLAVEGLSVVFDSRRGSEVHALRSVDLEVAPGEVLGVVGESGSGKSTLGRAILRLLDANARVVSGRIHIDGVDVTALDDGEFRRLRGRLVSTVFQNPLAALNPAYRIGWQIAEAITERRTRGRAEVRDAVAASLVAVGLRPEHAAMYPHQLSGGMRQRVVVAMAVINRPAVIIADEPTTALDVTVQAQILELLRHRVEREQTALVLVTHNMGVVAGTCQRIAVMYGGEVVEVGPVDDVFAAPQHPYTRALLGAIPQLGVRAADLRPIAGQPPRADVTTPGCRFAPRCAHAADRCADEQVLRELAVGRSARCWKATA